MRRKVLYVIGVLIVLFMLFQLHRADPDSAPMLMVEDALYKKISTGFYVVDASTKQLVPFARVIIWLKYDDDIEEKRMVAVDMRQTDKDGWTQVSRLEPNLTVVDTFDESKSNSYVVVACDGEQTSTVKRYGRLDPVRLAEPGHYDSATLELKNVSAKDSINCLFPR